MHADECAAAIALGKRLALIKSKAERGGVQAESVIRLDRLGDEVRSLAFFARVFILAEIRERPAVKLSFFDTGQIIGHEIVAEQIALVDNRPKSFGLGLPVHTDGIAQAVGKYPHAAAIGIDLQNAGAALVFFPDVFLIDVGCGADGDVQFLARWIGEQVARVVAVDRQVENLFAFAIDFGLASSVRIANDAVGCCRRKTNCPKPSCRAACLARSERSHGYPALPSPLVSLKSVIRFADLSGRSARPGHSRVASTTKISPLGKTYAWRGLSKFSANKAHFEPRRWRRHLTFRPADHFRCVARRWRGKRRGQGEFVSRPGARREGDFS